MAMHDAQSVMAAEETAASHRTSEHMEQVEVADSVPLTAVNAQDVQYPPKKQFIFIFTGVALASIMAGLDGGIVSTALPTITDHFHTIADIGWYYSAYRLTSCAFLFFWGKLYQVFTAKACFLASLAIFGIGNVISGSAPTSKALVLGRAVCGFGMAGTITGMFTILMTTVPLRHRPAFGAIGAGMELVATTLAPILSGAITQHISWRWCFFIIIPPNVLAILAILFFYQSPPATTEAAKELRALPLAKKLRKIDPLGTLLFVPGMCCLLLALQWGGSTYGWGNARIIVLFVLFAVLIAIFAYWQHRLQENATIVPRIIRNRSILAGMLFGAAVQGVLGTCDQYMPIYFQAVAQRTPSQSGIMTLPVVVGLAIGCILGGILTTVVGYYVPFMLMTSILTPLATGLLTTLEVEEKLVRLICLQGLLGFGVGIGLQGPQSAASTVLSTADSSLGIAAIMFAWSLGPALAVTAAQTIFTGRLVSELHVYAPGTDAKLLETVGLSGLKDIVGVNGTLTAEILMSYDKAITQTFYLPLALACLSLLGAGMMEWKSVKEKSA